MLWILVIIVLLAFGAAFALAARKPDKFNIERSIVIDAPADKIFPLIDDFRRWPAWSPWETIDPTMTRHYSGAASGLGAVYAWAGKGKAGTGRMEIVQSSPSAKIAIKLDFSKPFDAHNSTEFLLQPQSGATRVTWSIYGPQRFFEKVIGLFISPDRMVGGQFDKGLAKLKSISEA